ncbi:MAG: multiheme c-type cytochrome [Pseudomonadota bacterium]
MNRPILQSDLYRRYPLTFGIALAALMLIGISGSAEAVKLPPSGTASGWFVDMNRFTLSAHAALKCDDCHGSMREDGAAHPDEKRPGFLKQSATRAYDYARCARCHDLSYKRYLEGGHAKVLREEKNPSGENNASGDKSSSTEKIARTAEKIMAPTCGECHESHYERSGLSRVAVGKRMLGVCGRCHPAHAASYRENIHGREGIDLGNPKAALCTDCHGAHTVNSLKKPEIALTACRRCHSRADAGFTGIVIHASLESVPAADAPKRAEVLWIHRVRWVALAVLALSLAFFVGHSFLWLLREIHEKLRKH